MRNVPKVEGFFCWNDLTWWNWLRSLKQRPTITQLHSKDYRQLLKKRGTPTL
jgi:hypothetical protein